MTRGTQTGAAICRRPGRGQPALAAAALALVALLAAAPNAAAQEAPVAGTPPQEAPAAKPQPQTQPKPQPAGPGPQARTPQEGKPGKTGKHMSRAEWEAAHPEDKPAAPQAGNPPAADATPSSGPAETEADAEAGVGAGVGAEMPADTSPERARGVPFAGPVSQLARTCANKAREVLALEMQVQALEAATLGREDPETLAGYKLARRQRIDKDKFFRSLAGQFSIKPLAIPDPAQAPDASPEALAFFSALQRAYENTRDVRLLDQMNQHNKSFLKTQDWAARDRAVSIRDDLMDRGVLLTTLTQRAWDLRLGTLADDAIPDLLDALHAEVPEPDSQSSDLALLVLSNVDVRTKIMTDVRSLLSVPMAPPPPLPPAEELTAQVVDLQQGLLEKAGLSEKIQKDAELGVELAKVNEELESMPTRTLLDRKVKIVTKRGEIEQEWYATDPDPELFATLASTQEQLIRRRMLDLGTPGALFGARLDAVVEGRRSIDGTAWSRWTLLQSQRDLLQALDAAKPAKTPLDDIVPPPLHGLDLLAKAKAEQAAKLAAIAKIGAATKKPAKGLGSFSGKSTPKPQPKKSGKQKPNNKYKPKG